jgi:pimeloyl-ACP methyl ester carboxylesterase
MTRGRRVVGLAVAAGVLALPVPAQAALQWRVCEERQYECARLIVPLDHTGAVSGSVSLRLERTRAFRHRDQPKGVTLLLGGEPGESATSQFFGEYDNELPETLTDALPRNRVVVFDQRGTGGSGALRCRDLQAAAPTDAGREAEACATLLGARRGFYRTSDTVADIEALRAELAVARLTIVATGYGAYVAQRYALSHPDRVERLVLDTPVDAAVLCEEVSFPWSWHASPAERAAATDAATGLLTAELARPFGAGAAARSDLMRLCRRWPTASAAPPADPGPMPDVPVLVIAANTGIRNPLETARRTASRFARSQLIVAPAIFGTPLTGETDCVSRALERFLADRPISRRCPESRFRLTPGRPLPTSIVQLRPVPSVGGRRGQVVRAVGLTLEDLNEDVYSTALGDGFDFDRDGFRGAGLRGGRYALGDEHQVLSVYEFVPGVRLSLRSESDDDSATLRVDGPGRLDGRLRTEESDGDEDDLDYIVRGTLGGRHVRARLTFHSRLLLAIGVGE